MKYFNKTAVFTMDMQKQYIPLQYLNATSPVVAAQPDTSVPTTATATTAANIQTPEVITPAATTNYVSIVNPNSKIKEMDPDVVARTIDRIEGPWKDQKGNPTRKGRHNNPGNIMYFGDNNKYVKDYGGSRGEFVKANNTYLIQFPDAETGYKAMGDLVKNKYSDYDLARFGKTYAVGGPEYVNNFSKIYQQEYSRKYGKGK